MVLVISIIIFMLWTLHTLLLHHRDSCDKHLSTSSYWECMRINSENYVTWLVTTAASQGVNCVALRSGAQIWKPFGLWGIQISEWISELRITEVLLHLHYFNTFITYYTHPTSYIIQVFSFRNIADFMSMKLICALYPSDLPCNVFKALYTW